jgi:hypothetical protein
MLRLLSKRPTFRDAVLGEFTRVRTSWFSPPIATSSGTLSVTIEGDRQCPAPASVELARELIRKPSEHIQRALAFVQADSRATEFARGNGDLQIDGFSIRLSGQFAVELSLSEWPDAMITVPFENDKPCQVLLGD